MSKTNQWEALEALKSNLDLRLFGSLSSEKKDRVIDFIGSELIVKSVFIDGVLASIINQLDDAQFMKISVRYLAHATLKSLNRDSKFNILSLAYALDKDLVKEALIRREEPHPYLDKNLLFMGRLPLESEIKGLRGIAKSKGNVPIPNSMYYPSKEALDSLPTMMRIKALEELINLYNSPNVSFRDIDRASFQKMMFVSSIKHFVRTDNIKRAFEESKGCE